MIIAFKYPDTLTGSRQKTGTTTLLYGMHQSMEFDCVDFQGNQIDIQAKNYTVWRLRILVDLTGSDDSTLLEKVYKENIAVGSRIAFDFCTTTQEMYKYLVNAVDTPVLLELCAFGDTSCTEQLAAIQLPFTLKSTSSSLLKPTSSELLDETREQVSTARDLLEDTQDKLETTNETFNNIQSLVTQSTSDITAALDKTEAAASSASADAAKAEEAKITTQETATWIQSNTQILNIYTNEAEDVLIDVSNNESTPLRFAIDTTTGDLVIKG